MTTFQRVNIPAYNTMASSSPTGAIAGTVVDDVSGVPGTEDLSFAGMLQNVETLPPGQVEVLDADGSVIRRSIFADMSSDETDGVPDGMKVDVNGNVYSTSDSSTASCADIS